jgi:hypothetical protein
MAEGLRKKPHDKKKLQEAILDDDAIVEALLEWTDSSDEDSLEIKEIYADSDSEEWSAEGSSTWEETSSLEEDSESEEEEGEQNTRNRAARG